MAYSRKEQNEVKRIRAIWHSIALLAMSGVMATDSHLEALGHSIECSKKALVHMHKNHLLNRYGKRGEGYSYFPTEAFWRFYPNIALIPAHQKVADIWSRGGYLRDVCASALGFDYDELKEIPF